MCVCVCKLTYLESMTGGFCVPPSGVRVKSAGEGTVLISRLRDREAETEGRWSVPGHSLSTSGPQLAAGLRSYFGTWSRTLSTLSGVIRSSISG